METAQELPPSPPTKNRQHKHRQFPLSTNSHGQSSLPGLPNPRKKGPPPQVTPALFSPQHNPRPPSEPLKYPPDALAIHPHSSTRCPISFRFQHKQSQPNPPAPTHPPSTSRSRNHVRTNFLIVKAEPPASLPIEQNLPPNPRKNEIDDPSHLLTALHPEHRFSITDHAPASATETASGTPKQRHGHPRSPPALSFQLNIPSESQSDPMTAHPNTANRPQSPAHHRPAHIPPSVLLTPLSHLIQVTKRT